MKEDNEEEQEKIKMAGQKRKRGQREFTFDPKIHQLGREGYGFQMKRDVKVTKEELSGKNLPFKTEK